jgi:creatinine amidohydrolase
MRWQESTSPEIGALDRETTIVLLPIGSVEQHGNHMPVGTDTILAEAVANGAAAKRKGILVAPAPWYGFSPHHLSLPGTLSLNSNDMIETIERAAEGILANGFRRLVIVNGHGGNRAVMDVASANIGHRHHGKARIAALTYFALARERIAELRASEAGGMGHACEFETAMMLHVRPDLVKLDRAVAKYPETRSAYLTTDLLGASRVQTYLDFRDLSATGTFGDPSLATPEKGKAFFDACVAELATFIDEFSTWPLDASANR